MKLLRRFQRLRHLGCLIGLHPLYRSWQVGTAICKNPACAFMRQFKWYETFYREFIR